MEVLRLQPIDEAQDRQLQLKLILIQARALPFAVAICRVPRTLGNSLPFTRGTDPQSSIIYRRYSVYLSALLLQVWPTN